MYVHHCVKDFREGRTTSELKCLDTHTYDICLLCCSCSLQCELSKHMNYHPERSKNNYVRNQSYPVPSKEDGRSARLPEGRLTCVTTSFSQRISLNEPAKMPYYFTPLIYVRLASSNKNCISVNYM